MSGPSLLMYGSSPLARGTHPARQPAGHRGRFIPAGAGNTLFGPRYRTSAAVHPRWRGEHIKAHGDALFGGGSSPLARGTLPGSHSGLRGTRFIPAGAGNTSVRACRRLPGPVHPRWRGEHLKSSALYWMYCGSSPLARGTPGLGVDLHTDGRFIPAGAGNTFYVSSKEAPEPVHPRWRGEHHHVENRHVSYSGSSPLARGTLKQLLLDRFVVRFIPAGAGNTVCVRVTCTNVTVHPRWRGEHVR
ncbi:hypothetical protein PPSAL_0769 [Ectopseudomonas oleovorans]|uniref:Uncharacterized protein n=1 Tax=Ectopseudomonas oleovorans (strain CECT 5344) TaxID=1182590 RepID=W6RBZ9_ECTO5|nr:hypothetical protein BN5_0775 [Pseudomonas oleovorans CECT 5344]CDR90005.1 hypothetical protein PPSAL_0769 [Pseudomonas oleovorans]